ncbi:hypothetical protein RBTH_05471 [Bacillus thuringiensis serovar israelensis ATCC 35646]|nr:hypothetical protein RBTH_05471 [Bacillus thuringiensis serovar israelensis ATCC 35646]
MALEGNEIKVLYDNLRWYCGRELGVELAVKHPKLSALITSLDDSRMINRNQGETVVYATLKEVKRIVAYVSNLGVKGLTLSEGKLDELEEVSFAIVYVEPIKQVLSQWTNAFNEAYLRNKESVLIHVQDFKAFYENLNKFALETKGDVLHELNTNMYAVLEELNQDRLHAESQKQNYFIIGVKEFEKLTLFYNRYVNPTVIRAEETVSETVEELQAKVEKLKKDLEVERKEHMETKESMKAEQEELYTTISELTDDLVEVSEKADNLAKVLGYEVFNNAQLQENSGLIGFDTETNLFPFGDIHSVIFTGSTSILPSSMTKHTHCKENVVVSEKPGSGKAYNLKEEMEKQGYIVDTGTAHPDKVSLKPCIEQQIGKQLLEDYNKMEPEFKEMVNIQTFITMMRQLADVKMVGDVKEQEKTSSPLQGITPQNSEDVIKILKKQTSLPVFLVTHNESLKK